MLFTALTFLGCSLGDDQENFHFVALPITSVEMPDSFVLNETYQIKVKYLRTSDCEYFEGFDIVKEETTVRNVAAIGSKLSDSDDCKEIEQEIETSFNFVVQEMGEQLKLRVANSFSNENFRGEMTVGNIKKAYKEYAVSIMNSVRASGYGFNEND